jgi:hypothetical protein
VPGFIAFVPSGRFVKDSEVVKANKRPSGWGGKPCGGVCARASIECLPPPTSLSVDFASTFPFRTNRYHITFVMENCVRQGWSPRERCITRAELPPSTPENDNVRYRSQPGLAGGERLLGRSLETATRRQIVFVNTEPFAGNYLPSAIET